METWIDLDTFDVENFARSIEKDCQEGVKWEIRKLQWILEEKRTQAEDRAKRLSSASLPDQTVAAEAPGRDRVKDVRETRCFLHL